MLHNLSKYKLCKSLVSCKCHLSVTYLYLSLDQDERVVIVECSNHSCNADHSLRVNFPIVSAQPRGVGAAMGGSAVWPAAIRDWGEWHGLSWEDHLFPLTVSQPWSLTHSRSQTASGWWAAASPPSSSGTWRRSIFTTSSSRICPASSRRSRIPHQDWTRK